MKFELIEGSEEGPRAGKIITPHGEVPTPCFMPVGTSATVKGMAPWDLEEAGVNMLLANTYHLMVRPGVDLIRKMGGLHKFMGWRGPILTDSGGYQVVSLGGNVKVNDDGVVFSSHIDGERMELTPEGAVRAQAHMGVDIAMCLDQPVRLPASFDELKTAAQRTAEWAERSIKFRDVNCPGTALFGIVQGGDNPDLRVENARNITAFNFDGFAVGGLSVGEDNETLHNMATFTAPLLPMEKPRYLMGVGTPVDLLKAVGEGMDMFDCVLPTRNARNGWIYTYDGPLRIKHAAYREDTRPPQPGCGCRTCANFSRAYLRHLFVAGEMLAGMLITRHNTYFYTKLMKETAEAVKRGTYEDFAGRLIEKMKPAYENETREEHNG